VCASERLWKKIKMEEWHCLCQRTTLPFTRECEEEKGACIVSQPDSHIGCVMGFSDIGLNQNYTAF
jgi:hypothetical protein